MAMLTQATAHKAILAELLLYDMYTIGVGTGGGGQAMA